MLFKNLFQFASVRNLARRTSDHKPLLLQLSKPAARYGHSTFKFQKLWTSFKNFLIFTRQVWTATVYGLGLIKLAAKLKNMKRALCQWN